MRVWLPEAITTTAPAIDRIFYVVLWLTGITFVLVQAALLIFLVRYRRRAGRPAYYTHGNHLVELIWTLIPTLILVTLAFYNQRVWSQIHNVPPSPDVEVEVTGEQFAWNLRYPGPDGRFQTADDITTINQLHLPVGQVTLFHITSKDVIHSFFVPQFRLKQDAVPGMRSSLWVQPTVSGNYEIACAELCGLGHYRMRGFLTIEPPETFAQWLVTAASE